MIEKMGRKGNESFELRIAKGDLVKIREDLGSLLPKLGEELLDKEFWVLDMETSEEDKVAIIIPSDTPIDAIKSYNPTMPAEEFNKKFPKRFVINAYFLRKAAH